MTPAPPPAIWLITGPVLFLYVVAVALIWVLREANDRICTASSREKPLPPPAVFGLTAVSNLLAVATLVLCAHGLETTPRLSMLVFPVAVLLDRYGRLIYRAPSRKRDPVSALLGSLAGLAAGAWLFMRTAAGPERVVDAAAAGNVQTIPFHEALAHDAPWAVSLKLAGFYVLALAIFFGIHFLLKRAAPKILGESKRRPAGAAQAVALAFALNFLGVAAFVLAANSSDVQARLAMVGFPLFLIVEAYVKLLKTEKARRPSHWSGLAGSAGGMVLAGWFLLRGAPLR